MQAVPSSGSGYPDSEIGPFGPKFPVKSDQENYGFAHPSFGRGLLCEFSSVLREVFSLTLVVLVFSCELLFSSYTLLYC